MTRIFHRFFMWKMDPTSGCDIRLVFTLPPRDTTLQYKRCVHLWNNFPCIITLQTKNICFISKFSWTFLTLKRCSAVIVRHFMDEHFLAVKFYGTTRNILSMWKKMFTTLYFDHLLNMEFQPGDVTNVQKWNKFTFYRNEQYD